jgi:predicted MPP superfamily phosphohydrolase
MIVLTHRPDVSVRLPERVRLTLAGHALGGPVGR